MTQDPAEPATFRTGHRRAAARRPRAAPRRGARPPGGDRRASRSWPCPTRRGRCSSPRWPGSRTRRPILVAVPDPRRGRPPRPRPRPVPPRRRGRAVPGVGDAAVRAGVAVARDDGPAPAGDVAAAHEVRRRRARPELRSSSRRSGRWCSGSGRTSRTSSRSSCGPASASTATSSLERLVVDGLPARVPGRGPGRGRRPRLDRRRVPVDRRPPGPHRPLGRRGRPALGVLGRRPALDPRRRRAWRSSRPASCSPPPRCGPGPRRSCASEPWGAEQWERLAEGQTFDGMESWLPWLCEPRAPPPRPPRRPTRSSCCASRGGCATAPRSSSTRRPRSPTTLATTWGADGRTDLPPALAPVRPAARAHGGRRDQRALRARRCPTRRCSRPPRFDPVVGDADGAGARGSRSCATSGFRVVLAAEGTGSADRLARRAPTRIERRSADADALVPGTVGIVVAPLERGAVVPGAQLALVAEADLTGRRRVHRRPRGARSVASTSTRT